MGCAGSTPGVLRALFSVPEVSRLQGLGLLVNLRFCALPLPSVKGTTKRMSRLLPEKGSNQSRILALAVSFVPDSLDSGLISGPDPLSGSPASL